MLIDNLIEVTPVQIPARIVRGLILGNSIVIAEDEFGNLRIFCRQENNDQEQYG